MTYTLPTSPSLRMPANGCIYWAFIGASVGSDTRGATTWEAAADVNIAVEAVLVGETLCQLEGQRTLPVHVGNPEPGGCWDGDTAWRMPRRQWRHWPVHRAGLLWSNFFGQPGSVSKFPPFLCVKLWVGWVGRGYREIRYFPALWINRVTLVTKIKLWYSLGY